MTVHSSRHEVAATMDRLVQAVAAHNMSVFARIDHAAAAAKAGLTLRPTELLIFGNPGAGTLLMQAAQSIGIDLPLKALVWEEADGTVWLGFQMPHWLAGRHAIGGHDAILDAMTDALGVLGQAATGHPGQERA